MTNRDGFERLVSDWLHERDDWSAPDYLDEVLGKTHRTRQRPSWTGVQRWLGIGWRVRLLPEVRAGRLLVVMLALLVALLVGAALVGTSPRLPPPFGEAGNGAVLYGSGDGDLYRLDIVSGSSGPIVAGSTEDETPEFSRDGTRFVFARKAEAAGRWILMVADADGARIRPITGPVDLRWNAWSPDGTQIAVVDAATGPPALALYRMDGRSPLTLDTDGMLALNAAFRPDGREIVFLGAKPRSYGIYVLSTAAGSGPRELVSPVAGADDITNPLLSPDGSLVAYTRWESDHSAIHLVDVDSGEDRPIRLDLGSDGENATAWSPDGSRLLFHRHRGGTYQLASVRVNGGPVSLMGPVLPQGDGGAEAAFAPDGRTAVARFPGDGSHWLLDVSGGSGTRLDIDAGALLTWQRIAR